MSFWATFLLVAISVALADVCWTMYIMASTQHKALRAGLWSTMIVLCGSFATISFIADRRLVFASALGAFIGTTLTVLWHKKKDANTN